MEESDNCVQNLAREVLLFRFVEDFARKAVRDDSAFNPSQHQVPKPVPASAWRNFSLPAHSERAVPVTMFW